MLTDAELKKVMGAAVRAARRMSGVQIRHCDAPDYCGMCEPTFNKEIRPYCREITVDRNGIAYPRIDLDEAIAHYWDRHTVRDGHPLNTQGVPTLWQNTHQDYKKGDQSGISINGSGATDDFHSALELVRSPKQN